MHEHKYKTKTSLWRKQVLRMRLEDRMEQAEKRARDAVRKPLKRRPSPREAQNW